MSIVLMAWREIGLHLELPQVLRSLLPSLKEQIGAGMVLLQRLDVPGGRMETAACAPAMDSSPSAGRPAPAPQVVAALASWCRRGQLVQGRDTVRRFQLEPLLPACDESCDLLVAGLSLSGEQEESNESCPGAMVLVTGDGGKFTAEQVAIARKLVEPFAAGLHNDYRLRELKTLREAAEAENRALLTRLGRKTVSDTIVGAEAGLAGVMERVQLVARSDAPVLILGETGTGKEVVARSIHARSKRAQGPMIRVNCGAIPPELVDSELFGHERGSFTGATATRKGWFERADGGTLFLDEIGELPPAAQVRLLRVLQDGTFERVGGQTTLTVNVRVVAATHADLHLLAGQRMFRQDLWYRISVFPIHLPPLRDRVQDIPALATHFALKAAKRLGLPPAMPTPEDMRSLTVYDWPGNVRELASVIERAAILGDGRRLEVAKALGSGQPTPLPAGSITASIPPAAESPPLTLDTMAARHIETALRASHGRIEGPFGAAKTLGINPQTLRSRMRKLAINWRQFRA
ncbi:MAG: sigma-54 dependent transcriptional regulator [Tepidisphaeraceae bacterium]|jgi:transcriptional regulator with GAF, ATPase, and Fis domain